MKKLLLTLFCLFAMFTVKAQCDYTIQGSDSWGDGWNGASLDIDVAGTVTNFTVAGSSNSVDIPSYTGDLVTITFNSGSYDGEISITILGPDGTTLYSGPALSDGAVFVTDTSVSTCAPPSCLAVTNLSVDSYTSSTAEISWTETTATDYNIEYGETGFTQGTGTTSSESEGSASLTGLTADTSYDVYVQGNCDGDLSPWSSLSFFNGYCQVATTSALVYIDSFTTSGGATEISNTSSGYSTGGYGDFRTQAITGLYGTQSFDIAVTCPQYGGSYYFWVDWDNDLSFDNTSGSTEYIGTIADALSGTITVTIPEGQAAGDYVLRTYINNNQAAAADPCSSFTYGEYEDYTISVDETPSCTDVANINSTGNTLTTVDLSWTETGTASLYNIEVYEDGADTTTATPIYTDAVNGATSTTVTGLTGHTFYDAYVQADCGFSGSSAFQSLRIYTGYCTPSTVNPGIVFINNLTTTGGTTNISNLASGYPSSSPTGFSDHRDQSISGLYGSQTFDITFEGGVYGGTQYGGWWFIYVDWNNDLDFDPATELVYTSGANNNSNSTTITIPAGTAAGDYVIRVKVVQPDPGTETSSCADMTYGEVEDYTISVSETPSCVDVSNITVTSYTETTADLSWTENGAASDYNLELYPSGADQTTETPLQSETVTGATTASLTGLTPYTFYDVYIQTNCGFSGNAEFVSFTFRTGHCVPSTTNTQVGIDNVTTTGGDTNISNTSSGLSTGGYGDFRTQAITGLVETQSFTITLDDGVLVGGKWYGWVDWNNDLAFDNTAGSSEIAFVLDTGNYTGLTRTITIPAGQAAGDYVLRVKVQQVSDGDPCGDMLYGEVEDYTISVSEACSWNGATSTDWATGSNWSTGAAPTSNDTVLINGTFTNEPLISSTDAAAGKVILATGNTLTIDETSSLTVSGDFTNTGTVTLNSTADDFSSLIVTGTATGNITYNRYVNIYDDSNSGGWDLVCSPVDMTIADFITANGANIEVLGDDYAFAQYDNATGQYTRYATASQTGSFTSGQG
jgi:hypothetical protein